MHVGRQLQLGVQRPLGDDVAVRGSGEAVDDPPHQGHVGRSQRAEREVDERPLTGGQRPGQGERLIGLPDRGIQPVPARAERPGPPVIGELRIDVEVDRSGVDEFQVRQGRRALGGDPVAEPGPHLPVHPVILRPELRPLSLVPGRVAGERRRQRRVGDLQRVAGHDPHERDTGGQQRGEADHVVFDDHIRAGARHDPGQLLLAVLGAADQFRPDRLDPGVQLLDGRLAELRRGAGDELLPERPGVLPALIRVLAWVGWPAGRRGEVNQVLLEAERLQPALPRGLGREHHAVPAAAQHIADADAVIGRPVRALRHEQDGQWPAGHACSLGTTVGRSAQYVRTGRPGAGIPAR